MQEGTILLEATITKSMLKDGEIYRGLGTTYKGPVHTLHVTVENENYKGQEYMFAIEGGTPLEKNDTVHLHFEPKLRDPEDPSAGYNERSIEGILGREDKHLKPNQVHKIRGEEAVFTYIDVWAHGKL